MLKEGQFTGGKERTYTEPADVVRVRRTASATAQAFIAGSIDDDGIFECSCNVSLIPSLALVHTLDQSLQEGGKV